MRIAFLTIKPRLGAHHVIQLQRIDCQHLAIQKQQRRQRLVLRARCNMAAYRKIRQEPFDLRRAHRTWMALALAQDEPADHAT
ncbi:hypothetical protein B1806_12965 [Metallibacterium scheffleri]|uniref:Uncharacterized protein n=1 Tax=Metallibacterium scheffleri TaxID=993689 RepID=A0A4V3USY2_9GAMM|nr:hypothetical protein B1806_12965 [Metallibacterium scheffleri]